MRAEIQKKKKPNVALAKIAKLEGCINISPEERVPDAQNIDMLITSIKAALKQFVAQTPFNYPPSIDTAAICGRMLQFVTNGTSLRHLTPGAQEALQGSQKLRDIENKTGCRVKVTKNLDVQNDVLVSIIGPPERLNEASALVVGPSLSRMERFQQ